MELLGLGGILRYGGAFAGIVWILLWAVVGAILGLRYSRESERGVQGNWLRFGAFLTTGWFLLFVFGLWPDFELVTLGVQLILSVAFSLVVSVFFVEKWEGVDDPETGLSLSNKNTKRLFVFVLSSLLWLIFCVMFSPSLELIPLRIPERITWWQNRLSYSDADGIREAFDKLELYHSPHFNPYYYALGNLTISQDGNDEISKAALRSEAGKDLMAYAATLPRDQQLHWRATGEFFFGNYLIAARDYQANGEDFAALCSKFRADNLTLFDIAEYTKYHWIASNDLQFFMDLRTVIGAKQTTTNALSTGTSSGIDQKVLEELVVIRQLLQAQQDAQKGDDINAKSENLNKQIERFVRDGVSKSAKPPLPESDRIDFIVSHTFWVSLFSYPLFMGLLLCFAAILREHGTEIGKWVRSRKWFTRKSGGSGTLSRLFTVRLATLEPADEKGLFSTEVHRIENAVFPVTIFFGLWYLARARWILFGRKLDHEEQADLAYIQENVRKLSGKLIPSGDEQSLAIISALREKADRSLQNHRKGATSFATTRDELLGTYRELMTLGDILEALGEKPELTNYHLLGLEPKPGMTGAQIKHAYRSVMAAIHPDRNPNNQFIANLASLANRAYAILGNESRRMVYNAAIRI